MKLSTLRPSAFLFLLFLALEATVHQVAFADPRETEWLAWEGPLSLMLLLASLGMALKALRGRKWAQMALVGSVLGVAGLAVAPLQPFPSSQVRIEVRKSARELRVFDGPNLLGVYEVALGGAAVGDKEVVGDARTPLGRFRVCDKAPSNFHLWLGLTYPTCDDAWRGRRRAQISWLEFWYIRFENLNGRIPYGNSALGGAIGIHGGGAGKNWTLGCIALENTDMDQIYAVVDIGAEVEVFP